MSTRRYGPRKNMEDPTPMVPRKRRRGVRPKPPTVTHHNRARAGITKNGTDIGGIRTIREPNLDGHGRRAKVVRA